MNPKPYPSDLTNQQWTVLKPLLPPARMGAIPKSGDSDSAIKPFPGASSDKKVEDRRSAFNFAGKIHLHVTVPGESSVSENLAS